MKSFNFRPFSQKQLTVLGWWNVPKLAGREGIIADGAVRSGKTVAMALGFALWAMNSFDRQSFAICGKTLGAAQRNIIFWLRQMLPARGVAVEEKRAEHLLILSKGTQKNYFYIFGGKDERSQDLIQGMTLAGAYFDEVALMPETFVAQATARCSVPGSKFWFNCNPAGPYHWFKTGWIDRAEERNLLYLHFVMSDNLSLSQSILRRYEGMYHGVFYRRYILGQWCAAEGLVYPMFSEDSCVFDMDSSDLPDNTERYILACDYGTQNPFAMGLLAVSRGVYRLIREYYHDGRKRGQKTDGMYAADAENFVSDIDGFDRRIIVDPSAASFIAEMRRRGWQVQKAKNDVLDGIKTVAGALSDGRLKIASGCENTLREFAGYVWDEAACQRGEDKPLKQNDHAMDMLRYALATDAKGFARGGRFSGKGGRG
ncbi:MAG: PBSX family phage terminase large subunit [Oscillospiraceae bacterium]|nr:PBSX family phage terminase large subunit [Oscillospiraceae bacterium]